MYAVDYDCGLIIHVLIVSIVLFTAGGKKFPAFFFLLRELFIKEYFE